jgi:protein TonB
VFHSTATVEELPVKISRACLLGFAVVAAAIVATPGLALAAAPGSGHVVPCDAAASAPGELAWRYPVSAKRSRVEGRVLLNVLVDAGGRPLEVNLAESSGSTELDRAARRDVARTTLCALDGASQAAPGWAVVEANYRLYRTIAGR